MEIDVEGQTVIVLENVYLGSFGTNGKNAKLHDHLGYGQNWARATVIM